MKTLRAALAIAGKDLRIELRTGEITVTTGLFAVLVTIMVSLSFYVDPPTARRIAPGVLWIAVAFSGVIAMGRSWARERDHDVLRGLFLAPIPRAAIYLGKAFGTLVFLLVVEAILVPLVGLLFHVPLLPYLGALSLLLALGTIGFVATGSLFAAMGVRSGGRELALSVVLFPLVTPALLCGVVATREVLGGAPFAETVGWLRTLVAFDIVFLTGGLYLFEPLTSD